MPTGVFQVTDIPADKVEDVIGFYEAEEPAPEIRTTKQPNGRSTVTATFPGPGTKTERFDPAKFNG